jgi:hypothetical protein
MFFSRETLLSLLASRHQLYVQLGLIDSHFAAAQAGPIPAAPPGDSPAMRELVDRLERQIADINRRISEFRGPIQDQVPAAAGPALPIATDATPAPIQNRGPARPAGEELRN